MGWICCHLSFALLRAYYVYQGTRSANVSGNAALCEPVDLQSECQSMSGTTLYKYMYFYTQSVHPIKLILDCKFFDYSSQ